MKKSHIVYTYILFSLSHGLMANIAKVDKLKGRVMARDSGHKSRALSAGDWLKEGEHVTTMEKSFVRLVFVDQTKMNLGPNGEIIIQKYSSKESGIINLVNGKLRSEVTKDPLRKDKSKLFIKTKTAAMGVRGTDFTIAYNQGNTAVITFEGEVKMVKLDNNIDSTNSDRLESLINSSRSVSVTEGKVSNVTPAFEKAMPPVRMNPAQNAALKKNAEFTEGAKNISLSQGKYRSLVPPGVPQKIFINETSGIERQANNILGEEKTKAIIEEQSKNLSGLPPSEGAKDQRTGEVIPPAGGIVSLDTGLVISPTPGNSTFDPNTNTYSVNPSLGSFDLSTGEYLAPVIVTEDGKEIPLSLNSDGQFEVSSDKKGEKVRMEDTSGQKFESFLPESIILNPDNFNPELMNEGTSAFQNDPEMTAHIDLPEGQQPHEDLFNCGSDCLFEDFEEGQEENDFGPEFNSSPVNINITF